jgi:hypothetical protein
MATSPVPKVLPYALEHLFQDQDPDWVTDTIAPVLAWVPGKSAKRRTQPFRFEVEHVIRKNSAKLYIDLS